MSEDLIKINLSSESKDLIKRLGKIDSALGKIVDTVAINAVKGVTELALAGEKSKVPIDTSALRGRNLDDGFIQKKGTKYTGTVYIKTGDHTNRKGKKQPATDLANILNKGVGENGNALRRTQNSAALGIPGSSSYGAEARRSPTAQWKEKAYNAFISPAKLGAYLKNTDFTKSLP